MPICIFEKWAIDYIGPLTFTKQKNQYIILAVEYATKWIEAKAVKKADGKTSVRFIHDRIITRFGCPMQLISDNGRHFINSEVKEFLEKTNIKHYRSSPYYPQSNGLCERSNYTIISCIRKLVNDNVTNWDLLLQHAVFSYNAT